MVEWLAMLSIWGVAYGIMNSPSNDGAQTYYINGMASSWPYYSPSGSRSRIFIKWNRWFTAPFPEARQ